MSSAGAATVGIKVNQAGIVGKTADGWAIVDERGCLLVMSTTPSRRETLITCLRLSGWQGHPEVPDSELERIWRENKGEREAVPVQVSLRLN